MLENLPVVIAFTWGSAGAFCVTSEMCFQQITFSTEHELNKYCTAFQARLFNIVLSNFSMWHFNSELIFFGKQKQISLGVECYVLEEFGRQFVSTKEEHVVQNHLAAF